MSKKKVMILGAGEGQIPFINICKDRGYEVIVVSIAGDYPGFELADICYYVDTKNKEKVLEIANTEKIDAILTDQTDVSVPTVAYVAEKMGLRGIGYETALKFTNKYLMRKAAKEVGVPVPLFDKATSIDEALSAAKMIGYPLMIKPVDSSGSRGVYKIETKEELIENFEISKSFSTTGDVILETFISGISFMVNGFAMSHEYFNMDLGIKDSFKNIDIFVTKELVLRSDVSITDEVERKVLDTNKKLVEGIGLEFGITHADYLYNPEDGKAYLVEIAARGGGTYISSDMTPLVTGFNTNDAIISYVVEGKIKKPKRDSIQSNILAYICFALPEGEIISINGLDDITDIPGVKKVCLNDLYIGKKTSVIRNDTEKFGPILYMAGSFEESQMIKERIIKSLRIDVQTKNGIEGIIW